MKLITESGHFWLEFDNGYTLSVFNGYGSYTENHYKFDQFKKQIDGEGTKWESETIEVAILYHNLFATQNILHSDDSVTTINVNELPELISKIAKLEE